MKYMAVALLVLSPAVCFADGSTFTAHGVDATSWSKILGSVGMIPSKDDSRAAVVVIAGEEKTDIQALAANRLVIVEGTGAATKTLGFEVQAGRVGVRHISDMHAPKMAILWTETVDVPMIQTPKDFRVFAAEKWTGAPLVAGKRMGKGAILWVATAPGASGMERYPYLLHAAVELGLDLPVRATTLWAFFDSAYRIRADVDYLAKRWRAAGISTLHVAAWHNMEPDAAQDSYLAKLIEACHRNSILVYAWLELPHVSERFWADHPEWREKTALGQDAQLDWRKLMNLENQACRRAVEKTVQELLERFDWDGVNVAELYFESLEGAANPARFTPMNDDVRADFKRLAGFDPRLLFEPDSELAAGKNPQRLRKFLDYRSSLATRMQSDWLSALDQEKHRKPYLDVVLTHIDDRFEPGIRDALGADVARTLPLLQKRRETLLVEDPATLWNLGPDRYGRLAEKYRELTKAHDNFAVDINVVERYQDVYPTKKQTGIELLELVHEAAAQFRRVALYVENSVERQDLALLPVAASTTKTRKTAVDEWVLDGPDAARMAWNGPVELDGKPWPVKNTETVLVPSGKHRISPGFQNIPLTVADFNGDIRSASATGTQVDLAYTSRSRAFANVSGPLTGIEVDGVPISVPTAIGGIISVALPAGQHVVTFSTSAP